MTNRSSIPGEIREHADKRYKSMTNRSSIPDVRYIDKNALAKTFSVSTRTVCRWVADGMPALRLPTRSAKNPNAGTLRFCLADVERWIEAQNEVAKR